MAAPSFYQVLTAAVADLAEYGYDSEERLARWSAALAEAAERQLGPVGVAQDRMRAALEAAYARAVSAAPRVHAGIDLVTLEKIRPTLRAELARRVNAGVELIRLNRVEMMARQRRRFAGWATSVPRGGLAEPDRRAVKKDVRKPMARLPFEERRVMIDQGHKLVAAVHETIAADGGAIAARWRHVHQGDYDARPAHLARDGQVFLVRGSWADGARLVTGPYVDEIERPGEFVYCRCSYVWIYRLRQLPPEMLTERGRSELERVRAALAA